MLSLIESCLTYSVGEQLRKWRDKDIFFMMITHERTYNFNFLILLQLAPSMAQFDIIALKPQDQKALDVSRMADLIMNLSLRNVLRNLATGK